MPQVTLTSVFVRQAACPPGTRKIDFFDTKLKGLLLEVRSSGGKTYYIKYTDPRGRSRQFKIGSADVVGLGQARRKAKLVMAESALGPDPQMQRQEQRTIPSLAEFFRDRYLPYVREYKRSWDTDETLLRLHILPSLGSLALDEVSGEYIAEIIRRMRLKGYAAGTCNRVIILLRYAYNLARKWKLPGITENPTTGLALARTNHCERFLTEEETKRLLASIAEDANVLAANAILLLLLTGARRNEITHARWEWVNWRKRTLLVPRSKSGRPRYITLSGPAMVVLRSIKPVEGNPYIFASPITGRPCRTLFSPWNRIRKRAGLSDVRMHDLRHSFASFLVNKGVSLYIVQNLLGHTQSTTTQRYAHLARGTLQDAVEVAGDVIRAADERANFRLQAGRDKQPTKPHSGASNDPKNSPSYAIPTERDGKCGLTPPDMFGGAET